MPLNTELAVVVDPPVVSDPPTSALSFEDLYRLVYKDRSLIITVHFHFPHVGPAKRDKLQAAIKRSQTFCENCRYRFIQCEPFIVNLDEKERISATL